MNNKVCSFFGHSKIGEKENLRESICEYLKTMIKKGFERFLFGGFGEFDNLCYEVVSKLQKEYPHIKRVYVLCQEKDIQKLKTGRILLANEYDEAVYFPLRYDYWYTRIYYRNCEMIDHSDHIIFYAENRKESGAYKALKYALKMKKEIINFFKN